MAQPRFFRPDNIDEPNVRVVFTALQSAGNYTADQAERYIHFLRELRKIQELKSEGAAFVLKKYFDVDAGDDEESEPGKRRNIFNAPIGLLQGKSFNDLLQAIAFVRAVIQERFGINDSVFGMDGVYGHDAEVSQLGAGSLTAGNVYTHIDHAILLLEALREAKGLSYEKIKSYEVGGAAPQAEEEIVQTAPAQETTAGALPFVPGGGQPTKKEEEKEKKEEKEEEKKKEEKPLDKSEFKKLVESDRLFRREVLRIQSALTHQMATAYGIPENQYSAFESEVARFVTPIVLVKLNSLDATNLQEALLHDSHLRIKIYQQALSSLQRSASFQQALKRSLTSIRKDLSPQALEELAKNQSFQSIGDPEQLKQQFEAVLAREKTSGQDGATLTKEIIASIAGTHTVSADNMEASLRNIFKTLQGRGITESQINDLFVRLQSYGLSRRYTSTLTDGDLDKFFDIFQKSFGHESAGIIAALRNATGFSASENQFLASFLLHYSDAVSRQAFLDSAPTAGDRNLAALFDHPSSLPDAARQNMDEHMELSIAQRGYRAIGLGMFSSKSSILSREQTASGKEKDILEKAHGFKDEIEFHMTQMGQRMRQKRGREVLTLKQKTITYVMSSIFGFKAEDVQVKLHFDQLIDEGDFYEYAPYLANLSDDGLVEQFGGQFFDPSEGGESEEEKRRHEEEMGLLAAKVAAMAFLGPEAWEAIEKIYQISEPLRDLPVIGGIIDFSVFQPLRYAGKLVDLALKAMMFLLGLNILSWILGILGFLNLAGAVTALLSKMDLLGAAQAGVNNLGQGLSTLANTAAKKIGEGTQAFVKTMSGAGEVASEVAGAPILPQHIAYGALGIVGTTMAVQLVILSAFLTPRQYTGGPFNLTLPGLSGFEGCWPTTGYITGWHTYGSHGGKHRTFQASGLIPGTKAETAIDIGAPINTPIYSPFTGTATYYPEGFGYPDLGNYVVLDAGEYYVVFAHMNKFPSPLTSIKNDVAVQTGQLIGYVGHTGYAVGADPNHLHYGLMAKTSSRLSDIIELTPLSPQQRLQVIANESLLFSTYGAVSAEACAKGN